MSRIAARQRPCVRRCFPCKSATDSPEQVVANPDEATTRLRLKGEKSTVGKSTGGKSTVGKSTGGKSSVLIGNALPVGCGTGSVHGATCSRGVRGTALRGATCSRGVRGTGRLSSLVVRGIALLGECERGGGKRDTNREAQSFHADHLHSPFRLPDNADR
jgi:hypothetical protein